ncbi:class I SAM-dependent methyltransferase [Streptomyces sp. LHD-70]|uniref:class I SAM-dependent methyltransferase n=1 Tax=Streptomyces sp. LHD-70 TaxID=3072140 RepID=UPI00280E74C2|nr:class I SAM-dependent methyltransferase [Streptomyces sp. LHD-70]MDQ8704875.1 class I SAM-dependent methyltransferase [Streptomyces sp. LHD-70]
MPHSDATINARTWDQIASTMRTEADAVSWLFRTAPGPGLEILGDLDGTTVAELGCGHGTRLARLTQLGIHRGIGIDVSPTRIHTAMTKHQDDRLEWWLGDACTITARLPELDVAYSMFGALWFADPHQILPALHTRLRPGGRLVFSCLARQPGTPEGRRAHLVRNGPGRQLLTVRWMYSIDGWVRILTDHGYRIDHVHQPNDKINRHWGSAIFRAIRPAGR